VLSRRDFLKLCMRTTAGIGLAGLLQPPILQALAQEEITKPPLIWIELGSCTGESISLDNTLDPDLKRLFLEMIDLKYHWLFMQAHGDMAVESLMKTVEKDAGKFILVVEGSVVTRDEGRYNIVIERDGQKVTGIDLLKEIAPKAKYVMAVGACAAFGGPGAAYPNPSKAISVQEVLDRKVINIPGCPSHSDWMVGTIAHLIMYGEPELNNYNAPTMFFGKTIHDLCSRRAEFNDGIFADYPGDKGCFYKIGCKGPVTYADCPTRQWNNHVNWPVEAGIPCIGCASPEFPDGMMPFFKHLPDTYLPASIGKAQVEKIGAALGGATALGITTHAVGSVVIGRMGRHQLKGTQLREPSPGEKVPVDEIILNSLGKGKKIYTTDNEISQDLILTKLEELLAVQKDLRDNLKDIRLKKNRSFLKRLKFWVKKD